MIVHQDGFVHQFGQLAHGRLQRFRGIAGGQYNYDARSVNHSGK
jgi:hypothetical protein